MEWSPDGRALAVGYGRQGMAVWSASGCRLMCTLRQSSGLGTTTGATRTASLIGGPAAGGAGGAGGAGPNGVGAAMVAQALGELDALDMGRPLEGGAAALAWGHLGYQARATGGVGWGV